jgi:hypothetical protein
VSPVVTCPIRASFASSSYLGFYSVEMWIAFPDSLKLTALAYEAYVAALAGLGCCVTLR